MARVRGAGKGRTVGARSAGAGRSAVAGRRVLLADDHKDGADSLAELLRLKGHDVFVAYDGEQAVTLAGTLHPEVVLLDLAMPKLSGYEAAAEIRRQPWGADVLIIAITGWGFADNRRHSRDAGFDHHLMKPVELGTLQALLAAPDDERPTPA